ncbi:MAG: ribosome biogenesis GTPase Der [Verrucomicrobia bacterium]|nr:ribosome biogenesis GTPase Der [Verrucomicrobiota bacterium]
MTTSESTQPRRIAAIVGRPNVGKSALFNRLVRERISIVHEESGVTRDRIVREVRWRDERFDLVDTGGICNVDGAIVADEIEAGIHAQVAAALADAAVAILVVDIHTGVVPMDEVVAKLLRDSGCPTVVAANKADTDARDDACVDFQQFGFPVFPVSALHNRGIEELMPAVVKSLPDLPNETVNNPLKVAIVGRPNVGKSSYINRLLRHDRVIVSDIPGTTRDSIDIPFQVGQGGQARHYVLIDTAGMRRKGKIDTTVERFSRMRAEKSIERADVVVHVMDATAGPTTQDKKIAGMIAEHRKGAVILLSKWDLSDITQTKYEPEFRKAMPFLSHCPVVFISSVSGYNMRVSVDAIDLVARQVRRQLPTGVLNRAILDAVERVHPPAVQGKMLKIYYSTQVGVQPVRIRLFVNDPRYLRPQYREYLIRYLREKFGLEGAPLILQFSKRTRRD